MFRIFWEPVGFARMQGLVSENPNLKAGFAYTLSSLSLELGESADTFGESRDEDYRLGFVGVLLVLVRVDSQKSTAHIVDVRLQKRAGHS